MSYGSTSTLVSGGSGTMGPSPSAEKDNTWGALHVHVLPLFNRDPLKVPIEDLNNLVRKHMTSAIARNPGKAVSQLENDVSELITAGMVTLNSKLAAGVEEEKLAGRIVDLWGFFWDQVLPYVEGVGAHSLLRIASNASSGILAPPNRPLPPFPFPSPESAELVIFVPPRRTGCHSEHPLRRPKHRRTEAGTTSIPRLRRSADGSSPSKAILCTQP